MNTIHKIAFIVLIIGGLNWLALGVIQWEIGALFGGFNNVISRIIYILVGLAAIYELATHKTSCRACTDSSEPKQEGPGASATSGM